MSRRKVEIVGDEKGRSGWDLSKHQHGNNLESSHALYPEKVGLLHCPDAEVS